MGRGNCCVRGTCEGLYYIDNDFLNVYRSRMPDQNGEYELRMLREIEAADMGNWEFDELESRLLWTQVLDQFQESIQNRFDSFWTCNEWLGNGKYACLENGLFYIVTEDNEWSMAVELIQKEESFDLPRMKNLQKKHYRQYLDGIRDALFEQFAELGVYAGPWTNGTIKRTGAVA